MVLEIGVDPWRLEHWMYNALNIIKDVVADYGEQSAIITPAYGWDDGSQSDIFKIILVDVGCEVDTVSAHQRIKNLLGERYGVKIKRGLIIVKYIFS